MRREEDLLNEGILTEMDTKQRLNKWRERVQGREKGGMRGEHTVGRSGRKPARENKGRDRKKKTMMENTKTKK